MTRLQFTGSLSLYAGLLLAFIAGGLCYWLYRQETLRSGSQWGRTLPLLRSIAVGLIVLMLTGPTVQHRYREGDPGRISILIDDSASMTLMDGESTDRFARAANGLLNADQQILKKLAESHEVSVLRGSQGSSSSLWSSTLKQSTEMPESIDAWRPVLFESSTGLGNLLSKEESSAVVLITDGQVNDGPSLEEVVRRIPAGEKPVFTIGMGKSKSLNDVSIVDIEYPDRLFRKDSLSGSFVVRETLAEGKPYTLQIVDGETIVWAETLTSQGRGQRTIAFTFPIEPITKRVAKEVPNGSGTESALAIRLQGQVLLPVEDASAASQINGEQPGVAEIKNREIQFWASMNRAKVLIVDGRSRWETRYLKNLFDRDSFWELTTVIVDPEAVMTGQPLLKRGVGRDRFPDSEELLMEYDLIILGEVPADALTIDEQAWVHRFVSELGGGLIIVDGLRNYWSEESQGKLAELLPVSREPFREGALTDVATDRSGVVVPTAMGNKLAAFQLNASGESKGSEEIVSRPANVPGEAVGLDGRRLGVWATLPKVTLAAVVKPLPGGEVLATFAAASENSSQGLIPVMVTRLNGSGRVLYSATDETWRWRYKVADEFHQRFWNQISRWIMRTPYAVQNDYVSLDAGQMNYQKGQEIEIRCRLRDSDGGPLNSSNVEAILSRPNSPDTILSLTADPILPGVYRGVATAIGDGEYRVRVSAIGLPKDAMQLSTQFVVKASESVEMQETSINSNVLRQVAEISGGQYIPENQLETLVDVLKPLSKGRIVQNELSLWQSYWWFVPVVFVLSIEWWLRKKAGLL